MVYKTLQKWKFDFLDGYIPLYFGSSKYEISFQDLNPGSLDFTGALNQNRTMTPPLPWMFCTVKSCVLLCQAA